VCILAEEYEIISQMQVIDREVFFYLAQRTDKSTGLVGKQCRISYSGMAFDLSERVTPGRRSEPIVWRSDDVRNAVRRLVSQGVIVSVSKKGKGNNLYLYRVFLVESLAQERCAQKQVTSRLPSRLPVDNEGKTIKNNGLKHENTEGYHDKTREVTITNIQHHQQGATNAKSMSLDWTPDANVLATMFHMAFGQRITPDRIDPFWKTEWISYWWSRPDVKQTEQQWNRKYATAMIRYLKNPGLFEKLHGLDKPSEQVNSRAIHKPYVETTKNLPEWAKIPKEDDQLVIWGERHGYGHGPNGYNANQLRAHYRKMVAVRLEENKLPKIIY